MAITHKQYRDLKNLFRSFGMFDKMSCEEYNRFIDRLVEILEY